ncbi:hypothetical protein [Methylococcus mesophilus]|uniref:hypothetical protein n=1 Tax=Methylococcus mesophilus TaxID=2993564 RepID=UPI00224B8F90|nr:hypothetical protein [Methylococcus mesophilus]UZR31079.1 hypothetical protein OOT43_06165 [Methylococcus mesophilus]
MERRAELVLAEARAVELQRAVVAESLGLSTSSIDLPGRRNPPESGLILTNMQVFTAEKKRSLRFLDLQASPSSRGF